MPEAPAAPVVVTPPVATDPPAPAPDPKLIAGKYKDAQAAEKGDRELTKALGLPALPEGALFGEGRLYPDVLTMEAAIKQKETLLGKTKAPEPKALTETPAAKPGDSIKIEADPNKPPTAPAELDIEPREVLAKAGLTDRDIYDQFTKPAAEGGDKLTDAQLAKIKTVPGFEKMGRKFIEGMVRTHVTAFQANLVMCEQICVETAGDKKQLKGIVDWATGHYKGDPQAAADIQRRLYNPATAASTVRQLKFEHAEAMGAGGSHPMVAGGTPAPSTGEAVATMKEYEELLVKVQQNSATPAEQKRFYATNPNKIR